MNVYKFAAQYDLNCLSDNDIEELQRQSDCGASDREIQMRAVGWNTDLRHEYMSESAAAAEFESHYD